MHVFPCQVNTTTPRSSWHYSIKKFNAWLRLVGAASLGWVSGAPLVGVLVDVTRGTLDALISSWTRCGSARA